MKRRREIVSYKGYYCQSLYGATVESAYLRYLFLMRSDTCVVVIVYRYKSCANFLIHYAAIVVHNSKGVPRNFPVSYHADKIKI